MPVQRLTTPEEFLSADKTSVVAFAVKVSETPESWLEKMKERIPDPAKELWGYRDDAGKITAGTLNHLHDVTFDGHVVKSGGIGDVASLPTSRRQGNIRQIFKHIMTDMYERGFLFSTLYPFSHPYYRKFGYDLIQTRALNIVNTDVFSNYKPTMDLTMHEADDCIQPLKDVHAKYITRYNLGIHRLKDSQWSLVKANPYTDAKYRYVFSDETGPRAYVVFHVERKDDENVLNVRDIAFDSKEALQNIFAFFSGMGPHYRKAQFSLPSDIELGALVDEPWHIDAKKDCFGMGRIVNVEAGLKLMQHPETEGAYTVRVVDDFLPMNGATYGVKYGRGEVIVNKTDATPDMTVSAPAMAQLMTGFTPLYAASLKRDVEISGNVDTLSRVFIAKTVYFNDPF